jgi:FdhD protein
MSVSAPGWTERVASLALRAGVLRETVRCVPEETAIALSYDGTTHAVMMGTPHDLLDFAYGFSLTEGIIRHPDEVASVEIVPAGSGIDIQIRLAVGAAEALGARRRSMAGPVGCGLCGIESIEQALRPPRPVPPRREPIKLDFVTAALGSLTAHQELHALTHAVHAACYVDPQTGLQLVREDVGRHNALDKLAGALLLSEQETSAGAVVVTSRVSVEMVQKTAAIGCPLLIAVSAPTALAIRTANEAGIMLVAVARGSEFEVFTRRELYDGSVSVDGA